MCENEDHFNNPLRVISFHEAGHFVCLASLGVDDATLQLKKTCDERKPGFSGAIENLHAISTCNKAMIAFGGPIAESLFLSEGLPSVEDVKSKVHNVIKDNTHLGKKLQDEIRFTNSQSVTSGNWCGDCPYIQGIELDNFAIVFNAAWDIVNREWSNIQAIVHAIEERYLRLKEMKEARKTNYPLTLPKGISTHLYMEVWTHGNHEFI